MPDKMPGCGEAGCEAHSLVHIVLHAAAQQVIHHGLVGELVDDRGEGVVTPAGKGWAMWRGCRLGPVVRRAPYTLHPKQRYLTPSRVRMPHFLSPVQGEDATLSLTCPG